MKTNEKCPACGTLLENNEAVCPKCGMQDLEQIFLSSQDFQRWKEEALIPYREKILPRVFAGSNNALILYANGDLYGVGANDEGQLIPNGSKLCGSPVIIAKNVRAAAAGLNYTAYVLEEAGKLVLQGNDCTGVSERLQEITNIREVYAHPRENTFWILTEDNSLMAFGKNMFKVTKIIESIPLEGELCDVERDVVKYQGSYHSQHVKENYREGEREIKNGIPYRAFCEIYGECNVSLTTAELIRSSKRASEVKKVYSPIAEIRNNVYYKPTPVSPDDYYPVRHYMYGCGLLRTDDIAAENLPSSPDRPIRKAVFFFSSTLHWQYYWGILYKDGTFEVRSERNESMLNQPVNDVFDISFSTTIGILIKVDGSILYGMPKMLIEYLNGNNDSRVSCYHANIS